MSIVNANNPSPLSLLLFSSFLLFSPGTVVLLSYAEEHMAARGDDRHAAFSHLLAVCCGHWKQLGVLRRDFLYVHTHTHPPHTAPSSFSFLFADACIASASLLLLRRGSVANRTKSAHRLLTLLSLTQHPLRLLSFSPLWPHQQQ